MKRCTKCGVDKPLDQFGIKRQRKDGTNPWCKGCAVASVQRRYHSPGGREAKRAYDRRYNEANRERISKRAAATYAANPAPKIEAAARWAAENRAIRRAISQGYKARRRAWCDGGDGTAAIRAWLETQARVCSWCGTECADQFHIDHAFPLSKGGRHVVANLRISCPTCNFRKGNRDPLEFALLLIRERRAP